MGFRECFQFYRKGLFFTREKNISPRAMMRVVQQWFPVWGETFSLNPVQGVGL